MLNNEKVVQVIVITIPIFLLTLVGKLLDKRGILTDDSKKTVSWITYNLALPALIFSSFMESDSGKLFSMNLLTLSLFSILGTGSLLYIFSFIIKLPPTKRAAATYCSYWGNNGYMGIPLAMSAFKGSAIDGKAMGAVINGAATPFFIMLSLFLMYKAHKNKDVDKSAIKKEALKTIFNPVMITLITGSLLSYIKSNYLTDYTPGPATSALIEILMEALRLIGNMGLPLALILVGSNLKVKEMSSDKLPLFATITGKLLIAPLLVFWGAKLLFPAWVAAEPLIFSALVLLNAVPAAVASYIISDRMDVEPEFVSSSLVLSTAISIVSIPVWLYFLPIG